MRHRIAAGALVVHEGRLLLVRHVKPTVYDFWVAPGGGAHGTEDLHSVAKREVREETGLEIEPLRLAYVEEFFNPSTRECKFWFYSRLVGGSLTVAAHEAQIEFIVDAQFLHRSDFGERFVFPEILKNDFWTDLTAGFPEPKYLGIREMAFY